MQASHLIRIIKQVLKEKNISYKDVADKLELSESSIKRIFAKQSLTLPRIEQICDLANIDLFQLVQIAEAQKEKIVELSFDQEKSLSEEPMLILIGICIGAEMNFDDIANRFQLQKFELIKYLTQLDKIGIIELFPNNHYRVRVSRLFKWIPDGPLHQLFADSIAERFFAQTIGNRQSHVSLKWGFISSESAQRMVPKIERLKHEYMEMETNDKRLPASEKVISSLLVLFREDWNEHSFQALWKTE